MWRMSFGMARAIALTLVVAFCCYAQTLKDIIENDKFADRAYPDVAPTVHCSTRRVYGGAVGARDDKHPRNLDAIDEVADRLGRPRQNKAELGEPQLDRAGWLSIGVLRGVVHKPDEARGGQCSAVDYT